MSEAWDCGVSLSAPTVNVCGDAVIVAGYGSLATLMWKAKPVMRLTVRTATTNVGGFVVMAGNDVLADVASEAQGALLVARIESAIKESVAAPASGWRPGVLSWLALRVAFGRSAKNARKARWPARSGVSAG